MRAKSFSGMNCSVAGALEAIGDRWGFLILRDLLLGLSRYDEFQTSTGIPAQTLATRLKQLEAADLVTRRRYQDHPPRDEYVLTDKGRDLWTVVTALREWGDKWDAHAGTEGPPLDLVRRDSGTRLRLALVDEKTGMQASPKEAEAVLGPGGDALMAFRLKTALKRR